MTLLLRTVTGTLLACLAFTAILQGAEMNDLENRREQLKRLIADEWEYELREAPEFATIIGDYRYNDRWSDLSLAHVQRQRGDLQSWLKRFEAVDTSAFPEQEKLNRDLMVRNLKERIEEIDYKHYEMPIDQFNGTHLMLAQFVTNIPFNTTRQYEDYIARLRKVPELFDQLIEVLKQGEKDKLMPPLYLLEKTIPQFREIAEPAGEANVFGRPVVRMPDSIPVADRKRLHDGVTDAVDHQVRPSYVKLANFIASDYAPKGRTDPGIWALPSGGARYRFLIKKLTTTDMDPETIHQLGLKEVARIEAEQLAIAKKLGFNDLKTFRDSLRTNPKLTPKSREQILATYRNYIGQMEPQLPKLFGLLPKTRLEVRPVQEYREKEAAAAEYNQGTPDGSRPGIVYVNTGDYAHRSLISAESTAYHEAVPGHHMQISIAQTLPGLPPFRQQAFYGAYTEGWALYSERLGRDLGFYQDPYSDFGRLSDELLRAVRLVLDTGVHYKRWTRQQMIDYFHAHSSEDEPDIQAETDRYIAMPAQALSYKLGQLKILELRARAQAQLGSNYDIRSFHDEILNGGALPLDFLESRLNSWIRRQSSAANAAGGNGLANTR